MMIIEFFKKLMALRVLFYYAGNKPVLQTNDNVDLNQVEETFNPFEEIKEESESDETVSAFISEPVEYKCTTSEYDDEKVERAIKTSVHGLDSQHWMDISLNYKLSEEFMEKYTNDIFWSMVSMRQKMSPEFMIRNMKKFNIKALLERNKVTMEVIEAMIEKGFINLYDKNIWYAIAVNQNYDDEFLKKYKSRMDLDHVANGMRYKKNSVTMQTFNELKYNK